MAGFKKILLEGDAQSTTLLNVGADSLLTIATGAVTATQTYHSIAGEGGAADQLDSIASGADGDLLILRPAPLMVTRDFGAGASPFCSWFGLSWGVGDVAT